MDIRDSDPGFEWGADGFFRDDGLGPSDLGLGHVQVGACPIHFLLRGGKLLTEILPAMKNRFRECHLSFLCAQVCFLDRDIEGHQ